MLAQSVAGTIPSWVLVALALFVAWRVSRGGAGSAVSELSEAGRVLEKRLAEERAAKEALGAEVRDLRVELGEVRGRTDFATALGAALAPVLEWTAGHERRAQERHEKMMETSTTNTSRVVAILELVAERLGPEPNGDHDDGEEVAA